MKKLFSLILATLLALALVTTASAATDTDKATVKAVQQALNDAGYDCGTPDGVAGKKTAAAITAYQEANGLEATGEIDDALLAALGLDAEESEEQAEPAEDTAAAPSGDFQPLPAGAPDIPDSVDALSQEYDLEWMRRVQAEWKASDAAEALLDGEKVCLNLEGHEPRPEWCWWFPAVGPGETSWNMPLDVVGEDGSYTLSLFEGNSMDSGVEIEILWINCEDGYSVFYQTGIGYSAEKSEENGEFTRHVGYDDQGDCFVTVRKGKQEWRGVYGEDGQLGEITYTNLPG